MFRFGPHNRSCERGAWTRASRVIRARQEELYAAFRDPAALIGLAPSGRDDGRASRIRRAGPGWYRMSLFYPPGERAFRGKTSDRDDMVDVRFVELRPRWIIVQDLPPGLRAEDNEAGSRLSPEQLARRFE
jgi:hypothetical protein